MYLAIFFCVVFLLFSPKLFLFLYLMFRYFFNKINNKLISVVDFFIFFYLSISLAVMLANRPYYIGSDIGFGEDMFHYYNAFYWIINNDFLTFIKDFGVITSLTGSSEPIFWLVIKFFSFFTGSEYVIHISLTFLGCFFVYLSGQIWNKSGLLFLFLYTNTITFFAFQGSAIRSGLAFSTAMLGYSLFLKNKFKIINFLSPLIHFSMIPIPLITYASRVDYKNTKRLIGLFFVSVVLLISFILLALKSTDAGLGAKLTARISENELDMSSIIQFFIESIFTIFIVFYFFKNKIDKSLKISLICFFFISILLLFLSPTAFSRFYRYEYIFFIFIFSSIFLNSGKYIKLMILSFSLLWFVFIGLDRFVGVFAENIFDFISYNLIFRFN